MVAVDFFASRKPWIGPLKFDMSRQEQHAVDIDHTDSPIEAGGLVTDHRVVRPRVLSMELGFSSLPDELLSLPEPSRHIRRWRQLRDMAIRGDIVDAVTTAEIYPLMSLEHVGTVRTRETSGHAYFTVRLRRLEFAVIDPATAIADVAHDIALGGVDLGAQTLRVAGGAEMIALGAILGVSATAAEVAILAAISAGEG